MIGDRLKKMRKTHRISQTEFAKMLSVSRCTISSYENGNSEPSDEIIVMMCRILNISADYLLGLIDTPIPYKRTESNMILPLYFTKETVNDIREYVNYHIYRYKKSVSKYKHIQPSKH